MKSDIEIARAARLRPIVDVAAGLGLEAADLELHGDHKAKVRMETIERLRSGPDVPHASPGAPFRRMSRRPGMWMTINLDGAGADGAREGAEGRRAPRVVAIEIYADAGMVESTSVVDGAAIAEGVRAVLGAPPEEHLEQYAASVCRDVLRRVAIAQKIRVSIAGPLGPAGRLIVAALRPAGA